MSRPLKKSLFGNTNFGSASTTTDDGLGGGSLGSITQFVKGSPNLTGTLTVTIDPPEEPGGVQATATATVTNGDVTFVITNPGSGYRDISTTSIVTSTSGQSVFFGLGYRFNITLTGGVEHIRCTANVLGLSNDTVDIVKQLGPRRFLVKNANGTAIAQISPVGAHYYGNCPDGFMFMFCTDNNSARYVVSKISAHRLTLVRDPTSSGWLFASGTSVPWRRASGADGARTDADVTLDTVSIQNFLT
jgi:hypothetical protein